MDIIRHTLLNRLVLTRILLIYKNDNRLTHFSCFTVKSQDIGKEVKKNTKKTKAQFLRLPLGLDNLDFFTLFIAFISL